MPKIYVKFNSAIIKEIDITKDEMTFGRKPGNDIVIDHPTISGNHGRLIKEGGKYIVEDLNSTNGTFANGQRIKRWAVKNHEQIGVAGHIFEFVLEDEAGAKPAAVTPPPPPPAAKPAPAKPASPPPPDPTPVAASPVENAGTPPAATIKIISGGVGPQSEIKLKDRVTYIGKADKALIKISGFLAPDLAAGITQKPEGYYLKAIEAGYPKVNTLAIDDQVFLEHGAQIEVAGTVMLFQLDDHAKKAPSPAAQATPAAADAPKAPPKPAV